MHRGLHIDKKSVPLWSSYNVVFSQIRLHDLVLTILLSCLITQFGHLSYLLGHYCGAPYSSHLRLHFMPKYVKPTS